jgi:fructose-1,6-bisphosphatase/inositol monophosphatase family enzyme
MGKNEIELKKILKTFFKESSSISSINLKDDGSIVTDIDIKLQEIIIEFFKGLCKEIFIISEERNDHQESYVLKNKNYLIIDPIDGTENFTYLGNLYGVTISWRIKEEEVHLIYIPAINKFISSSNEVERFKNSSINLFSTKCIKSNEILNIDNARVLGSSSYMFYLILTGKAKSYTYCVGAKIWDCYTGLSLARKFGLIIDNIPFDYFDYPNHIQKFKVYHETKK